MHRGLKPHQLMPMPGIHQALTLWAGSAIPPYIFPAGHTALRAFRQAAGGIPTTRLNWR